MTECTQPSTPSAPCPTGSSNPAAAPSVSRRGFLSGAAVAAGAAALAGLAGCAPKTQAEVGKMVSEQLTGGGADMFESIQKMFKGMPVGDHNALGTIQGAMDTARAAYEQMTKASTEAFQAFTKMGGKK